MNRVEIYVGKNRIRIYDGRVDFDDGGYGIFAGTHEEALIAVNAFSLIYDALKGEEGWWSDPDPIDLDEEADRLVLRQMAKGAVE